MNALILAASFVAVALSYHLLFYVRCRHQIDPFTRRCKPCGKSLAQLVYEARSPR